MAGGKMKKMKKIVALIYKQYSFRNIPDAYFRSLMTLIGFFILHLSLLFIFFPLPFYLNPFDINKTPIVNYVYFGICTGLLYLVVSLTFKKKDLEKYSFTEDQLKACKRNIVIYFFILLLLLLVGLILHVRDRW